MKYADDADRLAEIERIVKEAAGRGTMAAMDGARKTLLSMANGK